MRISFISVTAMAFLLAFLVGCTTNDQYQTEGIVQSTNIGDIEFTYSCIEFDDMGDFHAPEQLIRTVQSIKEVTGRNEPVFLVVFVHGWKNNADSANANFLQFQAFCESFARETNEVVSTWIRNVRSFQGGQERIRHVHGVYLGWRGKGNKVGFLDNLTFWSRRRGAMRVSGTASTEAIVRLTSSARLHPDSRTILIGHSFGGYILERAVTQAMVGSIVTADHEEGTPLAPLADMTLLVNPASESLLARQFISMLNRRDQLEDFQDQDEVPWIISVTSESDGATKYAFPFGMSLGTGARRFRSYTNEVFEAGEAKESQRYYYTHTAGHNQSLLSHTILEERVTGEGLARLDDVPRLENYWRETYDSTNIHQFRISGKRRSTLYTLATREKSRNRTPYWVMQVPSRIIPDHSLLFDDRFKGLLTFLLSVSYATVVPPLDRAVKDGRRPQAEALP